MPQWLCIGIGWSLNFLDSISQEKMLLSPLFPFLLRLEKFSDLSISILVRWLVVSICINYVEYISNVLLSGSYHHRWKPSNCRCFYLSSISYYIYIYIQSFINYSCRILKCVCWCEPTYPLFYKIEKFLFLCWKN